MKHSGLAPGAAHARLSTHALLDIHFQHAVDASQLARTTFTQALAARAAAEKAESAKYAAKDWQRAEQTLMGAAAILEDGNLNKATKEANGAEERYHQTETKAIAAKSRAASK